MVKDPPVEPEDEFSTHKQRSSWFRDRIAYPMRDADPGIMEDYWRRKIGTERRFHPWQCAGPFNIAGRVTALAIDPRNPERLYAGAATGGVWRSLDGGKTWKTRWPRWTNANVGALAVDPHNPKNIYCGTGEANLTADTYPGTGIYLSTNGGQSWFLMTRASDARIPRRIAALAVHPFLPDGKTLYLCGISHDPTMPAGLYMSSDGGKFWSREDFFSQRGYQCHALAFHPEGLVFVAVNLRGSRSGIWRKTGHDWQQLTRGLPSPEKFGRVSLAICASRPDTIYALGSNFLGQRALGVFRSRNKGEDWEQIDNGILANQVQMSYNNTIAVHPENEDFVICGGNDLFLTRDGGGNWQRSTFWNAPATAPQYAHADHHAILIPGGKTIYSGNDGGVAVSQDLGVSWKRRDRGMSTTMFYDIAVAPSNSRIFGGGTQDNGTLIAGVEGEPGDFLQVLGGDGAWMVIDARNENLVYGSSQNVAISRHVRRGEWSRKFWKPVTPAKMTKRERNQVTFARMAIDRRSVSVGTQRLWRTEDGAQTWKPVSPVLDGSVITAIEAAATDPNLIFAGTTNGGIFRSLDAGATWSGNLAGPEVPGRLISQIETHPLTASVVAATVAGTGHVAKLVPQGGNQFLSHAPFRHIFLSQDGGLSWRSIDYPEMPDVAFHAAAWETKAPHRLFVAGDCGIWMTVSDTGWVDLTAGLPTVIVSGLEYHPDGILTASTYGRGIWRLRVPRASKKQASIFVGL